VTLLPRQWTGRPLRTVSGPTDHVVVVGAGLSGLSAALRLLGAGREVTLIEREPTVGGRCGLLSLQGPAGTYLIDTGPTVLTMPELIDDALACVGERLDDRVELLPVDPHYRALYPDGSSIDVLAGVDAMAEEVRRVCGAREADGYRRYVAFVSELYRLELGHFIDRNVDGPGDLLSPALARLVAMGAFRRLSSRVGDFLHDPRLRRLMSFQSLYAGLSPHQALAIYGVISYMDSVAGVSFPRGGMHAIPRALADAAVQHGAQLRLNTEVTRVELAGDRAVAVHTSAGDRIPCDAVVLTADLPEAYRTLLPSTPRRVRSLRPSPSCFLLLAGATRSWPGAAHHTISFGGQWSSTFRELMDQGRLMSDPSFLVTSPTTTDATLAPPGHSVQYVLFPTPHLGHGGHDWSVIAGRYRDEVLAHVERAGWVGFTDALEVSQVTTPADWAARGMAAGTPFAAAHTFAQTGPFRPSNLAPDLANVVFAGSGTVPGVGVPMVLISGRLAAERITGEGLR
jgi:phytoene desaturase